MNITMTQARRYLVDLVLSNDNKKSYLAQISENSGENISSHEARPGVRSSGESLVMYSSSHSSSLKQDKISHNEPKGLRNAYD